MRGSCAPLAVAAERAVVAALAACGGPVTLAQAMGRTPNTREAAAASRLEQCGVLLRGAGGLYAVNQNPPPRYATPRGARGNPPLGSLRPISGRVSGKKRVGGE